MTTILQRVGGESAVLAVAADLYERLLGDPRVASYFEGLDVETQVRKQAAFLAWAFGSRERYLYRDLGVAHRALVRERGLTHVHFDIVRDHLCETLAGLGVDAGLTAEIIELVEATRSSVLGG